MKNAAKTYPIPWQGQLVLACRKCQKKLKTDPDQRALAKIKKTFKRLNKEYPDRTFHVINLPCMDICPKGAVAVCLPVLQPPRVSILRNDDDIEQLFHES